MWAAAAFLALALGAIAPARGAVDANGKWNVRTQGTSGLAVTVACLVDVAQSGTSFAVTGSCELAGDVSLAGTFDPAGGTFTASGHSEYYCSTLTIAGTVAPDGTSFAGSFDCRGALAVSGTFVGSRCGNGLLDAGEQCDDGNRVDGDCCSSSCGFEAGGGSCPDDGDPCTDDRCDGAGRCGHDTFCAGTFDPCGENVCDGAGTCTHRPKPDGSPCTDWDGCTLDAACRGGVCRGTPAVCGPCQVCDPRFGCTSRSAPGCPPPKPARVPVTCRDGAPGAAFDYFGRPTCMPYCDVDGKRDGACTFRIPIAHGVEVCRVKERVIAVPVGRRRRIPGGDCRRPGDPSPGTYRLILHCRPHRQVLVCSLPSGRPRD